MVAAAERRRKARQRTDYLVPKNRYPQPTQSKPPPPPAQDAYHIFTAQRLHFFSIFMHQEERRCSLRRTSGGEGISRGKGRCFNGCSFTIFSTSVLSSFVPPAPLLSPPGAMHQLSSFNTRNQTPGWETADDVAVLFVLSWLTSMPGWTIVGPKLQASWLLLLTPSCLLF